MGQGAGARSDANGELDRHPTPMSAAADGGARGSGRPGRAGDLPQPRDRLLRAAGQGPRAARPGHRDRCRRHDQPRRVRPGLGHLGQRPPAWAAVQGCLPESGPADHARGYPALSRLRHDQGHRPGLRQQAGRGVRRGRVRRHRADTRAAAGGGRHRAQAGRTHPGWLGRAEGDPRDHAVPAQPWGRHLAGGADLQDLRCRCGPADHREPLPPGPRHPRHRLQDGRSDRPAARASRRRR